MRRALVVLQQVRLSHIFPQTIWHPALSVRRLLSDVAVGIEPAPFLAVFSLLILLPRLILLVFWVGVAIERASSGCSVAECIP